MRRGPKPKGKVLILWSSEFAYAIGLLVSDGCLSKDGRHIDFTSKDLELIELFRTCLGLEVKIGTKKSGAGREYYRIQFGDVLFYNFLLSIGLRPAKSKIIGALDIPDSFFADYLRGYFDGDGTSYSYDDCAFPNSIRFYIAFMSASPDHIDWLRKKISRLFGLRGHLSHSYQATTYVQLKFAKSQAVELAGHLYYNKTLVSLSRKHTKIKRSLLAISKRKDGRKS